MQERVKSVRAVTNGAAKSSDVAQLATPPTLGDLLLPAYERAARRSAGTEKPIALPWPALNDHFGGGLWPGVHYLTKGTGIGGTQLALAIMVHAARLGTPGLYVGLEMGAFDLGVRALGHDAEIPWSALWSGKAGPSYLARAKESIARLADLPIHVELARPMGYAAADIAGAFDRVRQRYPGESPILGVVDFLQLVGNAPGDNFDLRQRIGAAAYTLREASVRFNISIIAISSIARMTGKSLADLVAGALAYDEDKDGAPTNRRILEPDSIVGLGKESGEIEYSGDSVSVIARVPATFDGHGCDVVFATAKGRATGATWSPLHFDGHRYSECEDRGGRMVDAWKNAAERKSEKSEERRAKKEQAKSERPIADARAVVAFVLANPECTVTKAREKAVASSNDRWNAAKVILGAALVHRTGPRNAVALTVDESILPAEMRS